MTDERRQYARIGTRLPMHYSVLGTGQRVASTTKDASGGGACFFSDRRFERGTVMQIVIDFPGRTVTFTGEVMWSGEVLVKEPGSECPPYQTGVKFVAVTPQDLAFITQHCAA